MFVKAISEQEIIGDYIHIEIGDEVWGNARSYSQDFITFTEIYDNPNYTESKIDENGNPEYIDDMFNYRKIKVKVEANTIKRLYCGCGGFAIREDNSEAFCSNCDYERPEDHYYLFYDSLDLPY
jgi:hypothetical protein